MTTKQFIEKAIGGGWRKEIPTHQHQSFIDGIQGDIRFMILDPLAWQAVGNVENWDINTYSGEIMELVENEDGSDKYKAFMHRMIDSLCEGKSIDQFLETP